MSRRIAFLIAIVFCIQASLVPAAEPARQAGKKRTGVRKQTADTTPPVVNTNSSLTPANGGLINNNKPVIGAEYVDEGIGVSTTDTKLFVDDQDVSAATQITANKASYTPSAPLADGSHTVKLSVVDKAGNTDVVTWSFTVHTQPPAVKITSHKPNQYVNRAPVVIAGTISDHRSRIVVNGTNAAIEKDSFSAKVNLVEGNNTITAVATDQFGNTGSDSVTIIVDTKPPMIEITSPLASSLVNTRLVTVTGIADKNAATVTAGRTGGEPMNAELAAGRFTVKDVKLDEGVNTITVKAVSLAGNVGTATVRLTVDSVPPRVALTGPKDMTVTNKKMITVTGTVDKAAALVKVNNTPVQVAKGAFLLSSLSLVEGNNVITATAVDRAGNEAKPSVITVVLDTTPPAPPVLAQLPPVTRLPSAMIAGTAEAGTVVEVYVNSASQGRVKADDKGAFALKINLAEGNNAITAVATDAPGNISAPSAVMNVFMDTKPPRVL